MKKTLALLILSFTILTACGTPVDGERDRSLIDTILRGPESRAPEVEVVEELVPFSNGPSQPPMTIEEYQDYIGQ
ncbi:hypothetical protein HOD30_05400 [Candidatus Peregrinibacteria bacterium]|jgi:hypothetical protein|nr:hypothetical protein [Candidatus Peregrinibacteria bacterium]MBT4631457.1 hypothetical protein [Candidatus Peregrinibacteria bacterium]MBT5516894.1 hypothetical protein [Candidatus Peregrinibacteria bacterium]MBT5823846.1 hypothetical protein [Candidatus Peregrinibacteria bacterium]